MLPHMYTWTNKYSKNREYNVHKNDPTRTLKLYILGKTF